MFSWIKDKWERLFKRGFYAKRRFSPTEIQAMTDYVTLGTGILKGPQKHPQKSMK